MPRRVRRIEPARDHSVRFEVLEPCRQHAWRKAIKRPLQVLKAAVPVLEQLSQYQRSPSVADDIERSGNRAFEIVSSGHPVF